MCDYDWKREEAEADYNRIMTEDMYEKEYDEEEEYDEEGQVIKPGKKKKELSDAEFPVPYHF